MDREPLLLVIALALSGPMLLVAARWTGRRRMAASARDLEHFRWRELWTPLVPVAVVAATLTGWAFQEPEAAERPPIWIALTALPVALVATRSVIRALRSVRARPHPDATGTLGILRPFVRIAPALAARLDGPALAAVEAHERAHVRHYDPLRIWLARLATDLQGGSSAAKERLNAWLAALELARDEETRASGVDGVALAEALLVAARLPSAGAAAAGPESDLVERIERLLEAEVRPASRLRPSLWWTALPLAIAAGFAFGEPVLGWALR